MMRLSMPLVLILAQIACVFAQPSSPAKAGDSKTSQESTKPFPIDLDLAKKCFSQARLLARIDGGKLWGKSLAGPKLFVDPRSRFAVANQADEQGKLRPVDGAFVGTLPADVPLSNTAHHWAGTHWTMMLWPLPADPDDRSIMLMHESWHRIQADVGLPMNDPVNAHLDTLEGRYWLQLEWRALARALALSGDKQRQAIEDALRFRQYRRGLFKGAAANENALELNEGLAEYTGFKLSGLPDAEKRRVLLKHLEMYPTMFSTFVRSFAYLTGPAYGLLLDQHAGGWLRQVKPGDDLSEIMARALDLKLTQEPAAATNERAARYDAARLLTAETSREKSRRQQAAAFRGLLIDGPVLMLPLGKQQMTFNPTQLVPIEGVGTVYPTLTLMSSWGKLEVHRAALMTSDFKKAFVAAPIKFEDGKLAGDGWELQLAPGWKAVKGERNGDWKLAREK